MPITLDEVIDHGTRWFNTVMSGGTAAEQAKFFLDPNSRIVVMPSGVTFNCEEHYQLHLQWINELHEFSEFNLMPLCEQPERVRAIGTVYWQAENPNQAKPNIIKSVVGEDWILERTASGKLKFILYMNTFHHLLPDSASLKL